jgi:ABC-type maltose transport system permease subunit
MDNNITNYGDSNPVKPDNTAQVQLNAHLLKSLSSWATFKAVMDIITGALACLGFILVFPVAIGVLRIIAGTNLLKAVDNLKRSVSSNDSETISSAFYNLNKYFRFSGISIIICLVFAVLLIILYAVVIAYIMRNMPDFMNRLPDLRYFQ